MGGFDHDENQYLLGAYFAQHHSIYKDFLYLQPPFHALLLGQLFLLFGKFGYFFVARFTSFLFASGSLFLFYLVIKTELQESRGVALIFSTFFVFNSIFYMDAATEAARNDLMPLFFSLLAVLLILWRSRGLGPRELQLAAAGLCIAIALGTKLNYVQMPLAALIFLAIWPRQMPMTKRLSNQVLPLVAGGVIGLAVILLFAANDTTAFIYGTFEYYVQDTPVNVTTSKVKILVDVITEWSVTGLSTLALYMVIYIVWNGLTKQVYIYLFDSGQLLFWLIFIIGCPVAMIVPADWLQYYLPIIPFYILCVASLWSFPRLRKLEPLKYVIFLAAILSCFPNFVQITKEHAFRLLDRQYWTPLVVLDRSRRVDALLDAAGVSGKIATLSPALLIESKRGFYLELATGPFFYRVAGHIPPDRVERLHGTSPAALPALLSADMPAAVFGGDEGKLDTAFFEFAKAHGYRRVDDRLIGGILYVRQFTSAQD